VQNSFLNSSSRSLYNNGFFKRISEFLYSINAATFVILTGFLYICRKAIEDFLIVVSSNLYSFMSPVSNWFIRIYPEKGFITKLLIIKIELWKIIVLAPSKFPQKPSGGSHFKQSSSLLTNNGGFIYLSLAFLIKFIIFIPKLLNTASV
jgi:hypothetical protein